MKQYFYRYFYRGHGNFIVSQEFEAGVITKDSMVVASISELGTAPLGGEFPFVGDARMAVQNVAPSAVERNGQPAASKVFTRVHIDWASELPFQIVYFIATP